MSELDDIRARAAEFRASPYWTNYLKLDTDPTVSAIEGLLADLDRAIVIAEETESLREQAMKAHNVVVRERDEARAKVEWYAQGDSANLDGYQAAKRGEPATSNPYPKPERTEKDRRHYDWLEGWEHGNTEQELKNARAAALALRDCIKRTPRPNTTVYSDQWRRARNLVLADTEWLEAHRD